MSKTKTVFRKFKEGDIIALFPYEHENNYHCLSYMHIGQHSAADYEGVISQTTPANEQEYTPLLKELQNIGYDIVVIKRKQYKEWKRTYSKILQKLL